MKPPTSTSHIQTKEVETDLPSWKLTYPLKVPALFESTLCRYSSTQSIILFRWISNTRTPTYCTTSDDFFPFGGICDRFLEDTSSGCLELRFHTMKIFPPRGERIDGATRHSKKSWLTLGAMINNFKQFRYKNNLCIYIYIYMYYLSSPFSTCYVMPTLRSV